MKKAENKLYCFWLGDNPMSQARSKGLELMKQNSGLDVHFITHETLCDYIDIQDLHPAYKYLSLNHQSDYLRCYFMHHFGGCYCDVKPIYESWLPTLEKLNSDNNAMIAGYPEVGAYGVGKIYKSSLDLNESRFKNMAAYIKWRYLQLNYKKLIGNGACISKPNTVITQEWWNELNSRMDRLSNQLEKTPSQHPKEGLGIICDGVPSKYPVPWAYLMGEIFAPIIHKHTRRVIKTLPMPDCNNYR